MARMLSMLPMFWGNAVIFNAFTPHVCMQAGITPGRAVALLDTGFPCSMKNARGWSAMYQPVEVRVVGWVVVSVGRHAAFVVALLHAGFPCSIRNARCWSAI